MRRFGIIGYPLTHSFSRKYFTEKFERENIADCIYENFPLENIGQFPELISREKNLVGLNVTIPYKEQVLAYLGELDEAVQEIKACNCIRIRDDRLVGHNTDIVGFEKSLIQLLKPSHSKALILGTGGASKAVQYVLKKLGIPFLLVSRKKSGENILVYEEVNASVIESHTLIINTTPLGMYPAVKDFPDIPYEFIDSRHYLYDLVYNPSNTAFLEKGLARGAVVQNGYQMLILQAEENWRIWNAPV